MEAIFHCVRRQALIFIKDHNAVLPTNCRKRSDGGHIPGLRCTRCKYLRRTDWAMLLEA